MSQSDQGGGAFQTAPGGGMTAERIDEVKDLIEVDARIEEVHERIEETRQQRAESKRTTKQDATKADKPPDPAPDPSGDDPKWNMLRRESVLMTVLGQDPDVADVLGIVRAQIPVPADRLAAGPRNHRLHVVDIAVGTNHTEPPVVLHERNDPWTYVDKWSGTKLSAKRLATDRKFRAQNVFAVASHTLALFERHLGRRIPWRSGYPHLYLVPDALLDGNARYSAKHSAVLFGYLPAVGKLPAVHTSLSYDVIAHEMTHAILDGLRPRYTEPGLPDQLAFHEALADLVALLSVFGLPKVVERLLGKDGPLPFDDEADKEKRISARRKFLRDTPLLGLAEQLGRRKLKRDTAVAGGESGTPTRPPATALRRSVELEPTTTWEDDPSYTSAHRRAEILVAAVMQTLVSMWAERLEPFRVDGGMSIERVAEEGMKSAEHLLGMIVRSIDYLPPSSWSSPMSSTRSSPPTPGWSPRTNTDTERP